MFQATHLLEMRGIHKRFGATTALAGVDLALSRGEVLALIGENGAGKSTLMRVLSGACRPDQGTMRLDGTDYAPVRPLDARRAGIAMIYQELSLAPDLSVEDNLMLGQERHAWGWIRRGDQRRQVEAVLARLGHPELSASAIVSKLSVGARQLVEIARALIQSAKVVVFDEPTSALARPDVSRLFDVIRDMRDRGLGVIYISHFLEESSAIADRYCVLRDGRTVGTGRMSEATADQIVAMMVGRRVDDLFPGVPHAPGEVVLELNALCGQSAPQGASFALRRGEILGLAGLVGAGRTELVRCLYGLDAVRTGNVRLAGVGLNGSPRRRIAAGMGFVSEDRAGEGLALDRSLADNLTYSRLGPYTRLGWLNLRRRNGVAGRWMEALNVKATDPGQAVRDLSGGNQQKIAIGRLLHQDADLLLLDEPTRGVDVATKAEIYKMLGQLAADGRAILFVSSYLPELLAVCDRIGVMRRGRLVEIRPAGRWSEETIMSAATGSGG